MLSPLLALSKIHPKLVVLICLFIWPMVSTLLEITSSAVALILCYSLSRISWPFRLLRLWQWTRLVCRCARLKEKGLAADTSYSAPSFPNPSQGFALWQILLTAGDIDGFAFWQGTVSAFSHSNHTHQLENIPGSFWTFSQILLL